VPDTEKPEPKVELERFRRAWRFVREQNVVRVGPNQFTVYRMKNGVPYERHVNLELDLPCDCEDQQYSKSAHGGYCKHVLAAKLARMAPEDMDLIQRLGDFLIAQETVKAQTPLRRTA
jgi:hypothetical protein